MTLLLPLLTLPGCGLRPCGTPEEEGRDGELRAVAFDVALEAVETAQRHDAAVITYAWFELEATCVTGGGVMEPDHDQPFPLLQSEEDPDIWGGWMEHEVRGEWLELDYLDLSAGCYSDEVPGCEPWPGREHAAVGPWISAKEWYAQIWWPSQIGLDLPGD